MLKSFGLVLVILLTYSATFSQEVSKPKEKERKEQLEKVYKRLLNLNFGDDRKSYLGIHVREVTKENFSEYGLSGVRGVIVEEVAEDSPAAKAGLKEDDVIVRFNGEFVTSARKLKRLVSEVSPDHKVDITIVRNGSEQNLTATISRSGDFAGVSSPIISSLPSIVLGEETSENQWLDKLLDKRLQTDSLSGISSQRTYISSKLSGVGIGFSPLTKQLGEHFGVPNGEGILVNEVSKNSPAAKAGLRAGDVIVEFDGKKIANGFELIRRLFRSTNKSQEEAVKMIVVRNKKRITLALSLKKSMKNVNGYISEVL